MIKIKEIELDVKDIRELAAAYKDVAEGYGSINNGLVATDEFYKSAINILQFIDMEILSFKSLSNSVEVSATNKS